MRGLILPSLLVFVALSCAREEPTSSQVTTDEGESAFFEAFEDAPTRSTHAIVATYGSDAQGAEREGRSSGASVVAIAPTRIPSPPAAMEPLANALRIEVQVQHPLVRAFGKLKNGLALLEQLDKAIVTRFDLHRLKDGEVITLWEAAGTLEAFRVPVNGVPLLAIKLGDAFFDESGMSLDGPLLSRPLSVSRVTSKYGARLHPVSARQTQHNGVDYGAAVGTPVYAIGDGRVIRALNSPTAGTTIMLEHSGRYASRYLHLDKRAPGIALGSIVKQGQWIGTVGATGRVTGPHLHFELLYDHSYVDPVDWKVTPSSALPPSQKATLQERIRTLP